MRLFQDKFSIYKKAGEPLYKTPKSVQECIELLRIAPDGIFEVAGNRYSKSYLFSDVNYNTTSETEQVGIVESYCKFLNAMDVEFKITINNKNRNMKALREKVLFQKKNDGNDAERDCYNSIMEKKIMEGKQGTLQERYLTVSIISIDVALIPMDVTTSTLQKKYVGIESDIIRQQRVRNKNNDFSSDISYNKRTEKQQIEEIMDDVGENDQRLFYVAVTIIIKADTKEELEATEETLVTIGKRNSCQIEAHYLKQREALNTALPIGVRQVETMRTLMTQFLAVLMPFNVQELYLPGKGGTYYGVNQVSRNILFGNRKRLVNGNGFIFGVPGSGKSFFAKMEMGNVFLNTDDDIIVIDPQHEYFGIAERFGGQVVVLSTYTGNYINPMALLEDVSDIQGIIAEKGNYYEILIAQPEMEAKELALSLELFIGGSLNIFVHETNVDVDNRFLVYGIRDMGKELSAISMMVMMKIAATVSWRMQKGDGLHGSS